MLRYLYTVTFFILLAIGVSFYIKDQNLVGNISDEKNKTLIGEKKNSDESTKEVAPQTGFMAPDFTFPDIYGTEVTLSHLRGKVVFLNIWATWCGPCRIEMPAMEKLSRKFKNEKLVILAVSIDQQGESVVKPFVQELGLTFPILFSPDGSIQRIYMVNALPSSFIIDKTGRIVARVTGARDWFGSETVETFEYLINET